MIYEKLVYEVHGATVVIRLNDPLTLNSISETMAEELRQAFDQAAGTARSVLLTGVGRGFCSGGDISSEIVDLENSDRDMGLQLERVLNPLIIQLRDLPIPFVTAVNGAAAGFGCSIALLADVILASENAYFLQAFRRIGLVPDGGSAWLLSRAVGRVRAMEMMLFGEKVSAQKAAEWGLITKVVPDEALQAIAMETAQRLASGPTLALGMLRKSAWAALESSLEEQLDRERSLQRDAGRWTDFEEGVAAFREKRSARFVGR